MLLLNIVCLKGFHFDKSTYKSNCFTLATFWLVTFCHSSILGRTDNFLCQVHKCLRFNFGIYEVFIALYSTRFLLSLSLFCSKLFLNHCRRKKVTFAHVQFCNHFCLHPFLYFTYIRIAIGSFLWYSKRRRSF